MNETSVIRGSLRAERLLAMIFALLGALLTALIAAHWLLVLEPRLIADATSRSRAMAQAQALGIERLFGNSIGPADRRAEIQAALASILLLKDPSTDTPFIRRVTLILDYEEIAAPAGSLDITAGADRCADCFVAQIPLYHPNQHVLIGVITVDSSPEFLRRLVNDVRTRLLWGGTASLFLIGCAWLGANRILRRLGDSKENLRNLFEAAPFPMLLTMPGCAEVIQANEAAKRYLDLVQDHTGVLSSAAWRALSAAGVLPATAKPRELPIPTTGGTDRWALVSVIAVRYANAPGLLVSLTDISELKLTEEDLRYASLTDGLTGLANRRHLLRNLDDEITRAKRYPTHGLAIILLDLDHFKRINDTFGHGMGDTVLATVAAALRAAVRVTDLAGRYGGEEFLVILPYSNRAQAIQAAERIRTAVKELSWPDPRLQVTLSAGVCAYTGGTLDEFIAAADHQLYQAKDGGRDRVVG